MVQCVSSKDHLKINILNIFLSKKMKQETFLKLQLYFLSLSCEEEVWKMPLSFIRQQIVYVTKAFLWPTHQKFSVIRLETDKKKNSCLVWNRFHDCHVRLSFLIFAFKLKEPKDEFIEDLIILDNNRRKLITILL